MDSAWFGSLEEAVRDSSSSRTAAFPEDLALDPRRIPHAWLGRGLHRVRLALPDPEFFHDVADGESRWARRARSRSPHVGVSSDTPKSCFPYGSGDTSKFSESNWCRICLTLVRGPADDRMSDSNRDRLPIVSSAESAAPAHIPTDMHRSTKTRTEGWEPRCSGECTTHFCVCSNDFVCNPEKS